MTRMEISVGVFSRAVCSCPIVIASLVVLIGDVRRVCFLVVEDILRILAFDDGKAAALEERLHGGEVIHNVDKLHGSDQCRVGLLCTCGGEAHEARHERSQYRGTYTSAHSLYAHMVDVLALLEQDSPVEVRTLGEVERTYRGRILQCKPAMGEVWKVTQSQRLQSRRQRESCYRRTFSYAYLGE